MADDVVDTQILARPRSRPRARQRWFDPVAATLAGPALFLMLVFLIGPLLVVVLLSLTDYQLGAASLRFIGLQNYAEMFGDRTFMKSLANTLIYVGIVVPASVLLGLGTALLIEADSQFGVVNLTLEAVGIQGQSWLQNPSLVLFTLCAIGIWQSIGFNMVLFMAGLTAIPSDLYEAAAVDGANSPLDRFRLVTWPMLGPVTLFVIVITSIRSFQVFDTVQVITKGGPNKASEVLLHTMYTEGFLFFRTGYAAAVTVIFLLFVLALSALKVFVLDRRTHYS